MASQYPFAFGNATVTSSATAVSVLSLITTILGAAPTGACVSLNVSLSQNSYWGNSSAVTNTDGALVTANTPVSDSGTGVSGNAVPIAQMFIYQNSGSPATATVYARFIP